MQILLARLREWTAVFLIASTLAPLAARAAEPVSIKVGIPAYYEGFLPLYTAIENGYFTDEGLKVEVSRFNGGGAAGQAFVAKAIDLCLCSFDHVLKLQAKGQDAIAIAGIEEYNAYALITRSADAARQGIAGLRGKKIGITSPGSSTDIVLRYELKKAGIDPKDVTLVSLGSATAMQAALEHGQIDAGMVIGGTLVEMLGRGGWYPIIDFRTRRYALEVASASRAWLNDNPDVARRFVKALVRAELLLQQDRETAFRVTKIMFPKVDDAVVRGIADSAVPRLSKDGSIDKAGVASITDQQVFAGTIPKAIPYEQLVDLTYLPAGAGK